MTASNAELLTITVIFVKGGNPAPMGVKVIVSFGFKTEAQLNEPLTAVRC